MPSAAKRTGVIGNRTALSLDTFFGLAHESISLSGAKTRQNNGYDSKLIICFFKAQNALRNSS
jgi:hypothetical protein